MMGKLMGDFLVGKRLDLCLVCKELMLRILSGLFLLAIVTPLVIRHMMKFYVGLRLKDTRGRRAVPGSGWEGLIG